MYYFHYFLNLKLSYIELQKKLWFYDVFNVL